MRTSASYEPHVRMEAGRSLVYSCLICGVELHANRVQAQAWKCACGNVQLEGGDGALLLRDATQLDVSRIVDVRGGFASKVVPLESPLGPLLLGVVDPDAGGVAESVSWLLFRSIRDALGSLGGHLPDWLVDDIRHNYISPEKVRTLWAANGYRFGLLRADTGEMIGTIFIARSHESILTVNRDINNVWARDYPGFKPEGAHHVVNISVQHELRRARLGRQLVDGILRHFLDLFDGNALWVRADPPWHAGLLGLGFSHDPSMDIFLPASVERTRDLPHAEFNALYACDCVCPEPAKPVFLGERARLLQTEKLQYVSMLRPFVADTQWANLPRTSVDTSLASLATDTSLTHDAGRAQTRRPCAVLAPQTFDEAAELLARASAEGTRVTVRGLGQSAGGQALSEGGLLLLTSHFNGITVGDLRVTVGGGVRWDELLKATLVRGLVPPVVPGYLATTIGGTLSSGGFSKGSIASGMLMDHVVEMEVVTGDGRRVLCGPTQANWLFASVLGGLGHFGLIAQATLELVPAPRNIVTQTIEVENDLAGLLARFAEFAQETKSYHATVFVEANPRGGWKHKAVFARQTNGPEGVPLARYLMPVRPQRPASRTCWAHVFAPPQAVEPIFEQARALVSFERGDTLQWLPCRKWGRGRSLVRTANAPRDTLHYAILMNRQVTDENAARVEAENRDWIAFATGLGAKNAMGGALPRSPEEWRTHLDAEYDDVVQRAHLADPAGVLDTLHVRHAR